MFGISDQCTFRLGSRRSDYQQHKWNSMKTRALRTRWSISTTVVAQELQLVAGGNRIYRAEALFHGLDQHLAHRLSRQPLAFPRAPGRWSGGCPAGLAWSDAATRWRGRPGRRASSPSGGGRCWLCLPTDCGLASTCSRASWPDVHPLVIADHLIENHWRGTDYALVNAIRYGTTR